MTRPRLHVRPRPIVALRAAWFVCLTLLLLALSGASTPAAAQTRVLPLGDSITNGGQGHASYRYPLWFDLGQASYEVDFVGGQQEIFEGDPPNLAWYPDYLTPAYDPDHEGYWGYRTDEIAAFIDAAAAAAQPDVALIHLGTNDIGQNAAQGVLDADANLRFIIGRLRVVNPAVTVLLARIVPIGCCSDYTGNAGQVGPLNAAIDQIAADLSTGPSPVLLVDLNTGFDLETMMQSDGLHPNVAGEDFMAGRFAAVLAAVLVPGNPPPIVEIAAPAEGAAFTAPAVVPIVANAWDLNGAVTQVSFFADGLPIGADSTPPFSVAWSVPEPGAYVLSAVAEDGAGAEGSSAAVGVSVTEVGATVPIAIANGSFEEPPLPDGDLEPGPGNLGGWSFQASSNTYLGIFDPPVGSYPAAGGSGTPPGADGSNVAYLFNDGGPAEFVEASQALPETLVPGQRYVLQVAIGRFLPDQPYAPSSYGGYRIELLAGATVIASDADSVDPAVGEFADAFATVSSDDVNPALLGLPLSIRLTISATDAPRSTHFDAVRLTRTPLAAVPASSPVGAAFLALALLAAARACGSTRGKLASPPPSSRRNLV